MIEPSPSQRFGAPEHRRPRFRAIPIRLILPNLVTLMALALGVTAIRLGIEGRFEQAVYAIVGAAVLDGLDGRIARALKATSRFGAELDSLADFVDFGVAPAILLYLWSLHEIKSLGWACSLLFMTAAALRLARFNVMAVDPNRPAWTSKFFTGMPAPAGAVMALAPLYLHYSALQAPTQNNLAGIQIVYLLAVAFLMVSRIPHFSGKTIGRIPREMFVFVLFGIAATGFLLVTYPMEMLTALCVIYMGVLPLSIRNHNALLRADKAQAEGASADLKA
jgi:CDP-diacylglycerol--serine O-phosphatidyltransferase